jgi:hypothetical protein
MTYNQQFVAIWRIPEAVLNARGEQSLLQFTLSQVKDPEGYLPKVDSLYDNGEAQADDVIEFWTAASSNTTRNHSASAAPPC